MKCYQAKANELEPQWFVIDASNQVVGRLAARIAPILMGKHRPTYTPHIDTGDFVIVTNVEKVVFTGEKWRQKSYQRYTGHPGGQREEAAWKLLERRPHRILELAIQRMMPKSKMGRHMMAKLKLYVGAQHPHQAQQPTLLDPIKQSILPAGILLKPEAKPRVRPTRAAKATGAATASTEAPETRVDAPAEAATPPATAPAESTRPTTSAVDVPPQVEPAAVTHPSADNPPAEG